MAGIQDMNEAAPWRRWAVFGAAVLGVALTARLGVWQLDRAAQKVAMQSALDARSVMPALQNADLASQAIAAAAQHYRPAHLRGRWVAARTVFLENRQMGGHAGFFVVTPLLLEGRDVAVLVQRGWAPRDQRDRTALPAVPTSGGAVEIIGAIAPPPSRLFEFQAMASGTIRQNLDIDAYARETGLALLPLSVQQADTRLALNDGLSRAWPRPALDVDKHYGYAFQWFALAGLMTGLYVWFQLVRPWRTRRR